MTTSNVGGTDDRIARIASTSRVIPDFPKPGQAPGFWSSILEYMIELELIFRKNVGRDFVSGYNDVAAWS